MTPKILTFNEDNSVADRLSYAVSHDENGKIDFKILDEKSRPLPVPLLEGEEGSLEPAI